MFYMVKLHLSDRNFVKFLWFPNDDLNLNPVQYRLKVHPFGAKSSLSCANFALRQTVSADDPTVDDRVRQIVLRSFYVDDMMQFFDDEYSAAKLVNNVTVLLEKNGFNLTSFCSNDRNVLQTIPETKLLIPMIYLMNVLQV